AARARVRSVASWRNEPARPAQLDDLRSEGLTHGGLARQLPPRRHAPHGPRRLLHGEADCGVLWGGLWGVLWGALWVALDVGAERPVPARGRLHRGHRPSRLEGEGMDRAQGMAPVAQEERAGAVVARFDHVAGRIVDEDAGEAVALAQRRQQASELVHQRVDGTHFPPRRLDDEADAARAVPRTAVGPAAIGERVERAVDDQREFPARHHRPRRDGDPSGGQSSVSEISAICSPGKSGRYKARFARHEATCASAALRRSASWPVSVAVYETCEGNANPVPLAAIRSMMRRKTSSRTAMNSSTSPVVT